VPAPDPAGEVLDVLAGRSATADVAGQPISGGLRSLRDVLGRVGSRRPLLVIDRAAVEAAGLAGELDRLIDRPDAGVYEGVAPNPSPALCAMACEAAPEQCDAVAAVGGGSAMDLAKVAAALLADPAVFRGGAAGLFEAAPSRALPIIACPTTAGSGSEATHFAAVYQGGGKRSVAAACLRPTAVVLEARFFSAMPRELAAHTGLDALCQCAESLWAVGATDRSLALARAGLELAAKNLRAAVTRGEEHSRVAMAAAAYLSGCAINIGKTTAAHALSYPMTTRHGIAHGHAVALALGPVVAATAEALGSGACAHPRGRSWVSGRLAEAAVALGATPDGLPTAIARLLADLGLAPTASAAGVDDIWSVVSAADPVRLGNHPCALSPRMVARRFCVDGVSVE